MNAADKEIILELLMIRLKLYKEKNNSAEHWDVAGVYLAYYLSQEGNIF